MSLEAHELALSVLHRGMHWREDLQRLEQLAGATPLAEWWPEAGVAERSRFMADFLELYLSDIVFRETIDTLMERVG